MQKVVLVCLFVVFGLSSCYEDNVDAGFDYQNGDVATFVPDLSKAVDSVMFYMDKEWIGTEREIPFVLHYKIQNMSSGDHILKMDIYQSWVGNSRSIITIKKTVKVK